MKEQGRRALTISIVDCLSGVLAGLMESVGSAVRVERAEAALDKVNKKDSDDEVSFFVPAWTIALTTRSLLFTAALFDQK